MTAKILIIIDQTEDQLSAMNETLDAALALASFNENVHLWFKKNALKLLLKSATRQIPIIDALQYYGVSEIFVSPIDFNKLNKEQNAFRCSFNYLPDHELFKFLNRYENVLRFN